MLFSKFMLIVDATGAGYDGHWSVALVSKDDLHLRLALKGSFTIFLFLVRSHILNSNVVWYS